MFPISTVDKPEFKAMLQEFNLKCQLPSLNHFTKVSIPELVEGDVEREIAVTNMEYFSATTDLWT